MSPTESDILNIITAGTMAPSINNCQPWRFEVGPGFIDLYNVPEQDHSLYNWGQRPSYIANGAVIENMTIAAARSGYRLSPKILPSSGKPEHVARLYLERAPGDSHPLYDAIFTRTTNRKPYASRPLTADQTERFRSISVPSAGLILATDERRRHSLAGSAALDERIRFEDKQMHRSFFSHINWTDRHDAERGIGSSLKALELSPSLRAGFAVLRHYPVLKLLNAVGLSAVMTRASASTLATGAAIGGVVIPARDAVHFVNAGRCLQRAWLTATTLRLHLQPLAGITLLMNRIADGDGTLSEGHARLVTSTYGDICEALNVKDGVVACLFRLGHAEPPSARTPRLKPDIRPAENT